MSPTYLNAWGGQRGLPLSRGVRLEHVLLILVLVVIILQITSLWISGRAARGADAETALAEAPGAGQAASSSGYTTNTSASGGGTGAGEPQTARQWVENSSQKDALIEQLMQNLSEWQAKSRQDQSWLQSKDLQIQRLTAQLVEQQQVNEQLQEQFRIQNATLQEQATKIDGLKKKLDELRSQVDELAALIK